ncbi:MAG: ribonuclease E/G [Clostridia bacterium]|nr:ribonuclease E/G [Clostridia bacterium]
MKDNHLYAYRSSESGGGICEDQIYLAVVDRMAKGVNAAFVKLPHGDFGFLPYDKEKRALRSGERVLVQVKRPPNNAKKAFLTLDVSIGGKYLVLLPNGGGISVSKSIEDEDVRKALRLLGKKLKPAAFGIIMRADSVNADPEVIELERDELLKRYEEISKRANTLPAPALLWDGEDIVSQLLHEEEKQLEYVLTNAPELLPPTLSCPVRQADEPFLLHNVDHKLKRSQLRTFLMKSGATLVIDRCEAMTVIDVNSAMSGGGRNIADTAEKINTEAAREIARLLRLLRIGGMILIDFIDMATDEARDHLISYMKELLKDDPIKTVVHDITPLGIMELTRHRADTPLPALPDIPCPHCAGLGVIPESEDDSLHA